MRIFLWPLRTWFFLFCFLLFPFSTQALALVEWNFPNTSADVTADGGIFDNLIQKISGSGVSSISFVGRGTAGDKAASARSWNNSALERYWQISFSTKGYQNITLSSQQSSSPTGPRDFTTQYRLSEDAPWQDIPGGAITTEDNFVRGVLTALPLPEETHNHPTVFVRFLAVGNTNVAGTIIGATGTNRIDTLTLAGEPIADPGDEDPLDTLCTGDKENITLSEILPYPKTGDEEYVELHNADGTCINISGWRFVDDGNHSYILPANTIIEGGQYLTFIRNFYLNNSTGETLTLFDSENEKRGNVTYEKPLAGLSYNFNGNDWLFSSFQTPGAANIFDEEEVEEDPIVETDQKVILNEILPNPSGDEAAGEYIELFNPSDQTVMLKNWTLHDTSRTRLIFDTEVVLPKSYLLLPRSVFKFSLNNTGVETVSLFRSNGSVASTVSYADAKEDASYSFNGNAFRFSAHLTPGAENQFSKEPKIHIESNKQGFVNLPLIFQANLTKKYKKKNSTFVWNFGDGKTSRLATPKHTYTKTGKYPVTITIKNKTVEASKTFNVSINSYPKTPVVIARLLPNPKGKDADSEWIEVQNLSPKNVSLKDWKIATGSDAENLSNHTFTTDILLPAKATHKITGVENTFSLNNSASLIELRYPSGEAASLAKYEEENIPEDAVCENQEGLCDFENTKKKENGTGEETAKQVLGASITDAKEIPTDMGENQVAQVFPLTEKQVLQNRIKQDTNALINLYLREWTSR